MKLSRIALLTLATVVLSWGPGTREDLKRSSLANHSQTLANNDNLALKEALVALEKQSWEAWQKRDGKFFREFLSADHVEVGFNGPATKAQVVAFVGNPICVVKSYAVDHFELAPVRPQYSVTNLSRCARYDL